MTAESIELTDEEIERVTGYKIPHKQKEWLDGADIPCKIKADGHVCVLRAWAENAPFYQALADHQRPPRPELPDIGEFGG